jgi:hypothetical protein
MIIRRFTILGLSLVSLCVIGMLVAWSNGHVLDEGERAAQWRKVTDAINKGLPQTAIKEIEPIIASALKDKDYPEAIKAIAKLIAYEGMIQGNKPEERITRMKAEIAKAPKEMVPVMDAILAQWYWHYFQQNRWRFMQRTATAAAPGEDFTTWDLPRLFKEIDAQFTKALSHERELAAIPIKQYDGLLDKGTLPDTYRPTLFDFIAFEALQFYTSGEQAAAKAQDAFEIEANSPIFGTIEAFLAWKPATTDADSPKLKAILLFQKLLGNHLKDDDRHAFLDADLHRLRFGYQQALGEEKNILYKKALNTFAKAHVGNELSARARADWAGVLHAENDFVGARNLAIQGRNTFPASLGGKMCHNLIESIEAKHVQVQTERVWAKPFAKLQVNYRNLTQIHFRAYKASWTDRATSVNVRPEHLQEPERQQLLTRKPDAAWSATLPATEDYLERVEEVKAPETLAPGFYFLMSCPSDEFAANGPPVQVCHFWVSDLALVMRHEGNTQAEGFVLNSNTGEPIAGAAIKTWRRDYRTQRVNPGETLTTDQNGLFRLTEKAQMPVMIYAIHQGHEIVAENDAYLYPQGNQRNVVMEQAVLFTDRSLYRPGQTVHFKGIALSVNQGESKYQTIARRPITVIFSDPNNKEIGKLQVTSNEVGSFSGSFIVPRDRLAGRMNLRTVNPRGFIQFSVEEYKRPKFEVTLEPPTESPKLAGPVKYVGKALGYSGAALSSAKLRYRVSREVRYPSWWGYYYSWRMPPGGQNAAQEIAHGTGITEADGTFTITFTAKPDASVAEKDEPIFNYVVSVDVTDTTGETRSASRSVQIGYTALQASMTVDEWQTKDKPVNVNVLTQTIDGQGQAAKGKIKVYRLKQPEQVLRASAFGGRPSPPVRRGRGPAVKSVPVKPVPDPADPRTWELGEIVSTLDFATDASGKATLPATLGTGIYRALLETQDRFGKPVTAVVQFNVVDPAANKLALKLPHVLTAPKWSIEPGSEFSALWGTGYETGRAFIELEYRQKIIQSFWTIGDKTQHLIKQAIDESMRGGLTLRVTYVRENRAYLESRMIDVPWTNKNLQVKWERFVSKLEPGQKETWTAVITGPDARKAVAEMVATLYDASLDAYLPHHWAKHFNVFYRNYPRWNSRFENHAMALYHITGNWSQSYQVVDERYRVFPADITQNIWHYQYWDRAPGAPGGTGGMRAGGGAPMKSAAMDSARFENTAGFAAESKAEGGERVLLSSAMAKKDGEAPMKMPAVQPDLSQVTPRTNLAETAFFFPHLIADDNGTVKLEFTMPQALTKWKFMGFVHDKDLRAGYLEDSVVTAKDLMVQPNPPRFLREGDQIEFTVKVSNQSATRQNGQVRLNLTDARTGKTLDADLGNTTLDNAFDIPAKESRSFSWKLKVPDGIGPITYKAVGGTERLSDGEEGMLPVLSKRILVTESLPLPIRDKQTKNFTFTKLLESAKSDTIKSQTLTVQMVSNPSWYAVMALPYLMEYPHECSEQTFNRLYANTLARHIATSDPKIRKIFDQWKNTPALDSPLEKNQDLKAAMLEETPWLRQAVKESESRRNVGILFDDNRLKNEMDRALRKLLDLQNADGAWSWFPGGPSNEYITLYITTGFGRLRHLGVKFDMAPAIRSLDRLDAWMDRHYREIIKHPGKEKNHLSTQVALYLYGRSFFLKDKRVAPQYQEALNYWLGQAKQYWLQLGHRQSQGHLALALHRWGSKDNAQGIMRSIKERSVTNEELGRFWRDTEYSFWWYHAPIETQAVMIEAFDEVMNDQAAVEDCKVWLLKQKQTQNWKTTKSTADAVYSLLLRGDNLLKSDALVEMSLAGTPIKPEKVEAGTGFYEQKFVRGEIKPDFGKIELKKTDPGVAWGSIHWQYLEDISKVTPHEATPLKLQKQLFRRTYTKKGPVLEALAGPAAVGDELIVRIVLRTDRDMEYVHLKDHRGSGTEPVNVLSRYKYQDGLGYYESTKDTASHFFIDYLPKGTYVFEYALRVQLKGSYTTGMAHIECMYAPEFNSHSESIQLEVK